MKKYISIMMVAASGLALSSCDDFLDKMPDNRTTIDSKEKVQLLLVNAYPGSNIAPICELSSDNMVDLNAPDDAGKYFNLSPFDRSNDEAFAWNEIVSSVSNDSPKYIWDESYHAVATANAALDAIALLEAEGKDMSAEKGEALLCRAFGHFLLVNVFCQPYRDETASLEDLGVPYMTYSENVVSGNYERGSVAKTYESIIADIEEGVSLIDDASYYTVPKYHFNSNAAHAFAARAYLYMRNYEKVIEHASAVLGTTLSTAKSKMRSDITIYSDPDVEFYAWINKDEPANLLVLPTRSTFLRLFRKRRYSLVGTAQKETLKSSGPVWSSTFPGYNSWTYGASYGGFVAKIKEQFEYTDKVAGIGFCHIVRNEFTSGETILARAEAYAMLGRTAEAVADLNIWTTANNCSSELTLAKINSFYTSNNSLCKTLNPSAVSSQFTLDADKEPMIQCILHFRRLETIHDGLRWLDIKRWGLELTHYVGRNLTLKLAADDQRKAIQLPQDVLMSGMQANPRPSDIDLSSCDFGHADPNLLAAPITDALMKNEY